MRRVFRSFGLGLAFTAIVVDAISVYIFHDVDPDRIGQWNRAYVELCWEAALFVVIVALPVWLLTLIGRWIFHLRAVTPRPGLALLIGIVTIVFQYP
jgi:hypothetical protein